MERLVWMLGMADNIVNLAKQHEEVAHMRELRVLGTAIRSELEYLQVCRKVPPTRIELVEPMMRHLETEMQSAHAGDDTQRARLKEKLEFFLRIIHSVE